MLPPYEGAPENVFPGVLLAGFLNLLAVAVVAPAVGLLLRRRRPDLPRLIASNYAGSWLLLAITALLAGAGLLHRGAVDAEQAREQAVAGAMHDYVLREEPGSARLARHHRPDPDRPRLLPRLHPRRRARALALPVRDHRPASAGRHARHRGGPEPRVPAVRRVRLICGTNFGGWGVAMSRREGHCPEIAAAPPGTCAPAAFSAPRPPPENPSRPPRRRRSLRAQLQRVLEPLADAPGTRRRRRRRGSGGRRRA